MEIQEKKFFLKKYDRLAREIMLVHARHPMDVIIPDAPNFIYRVGNWLTYLVGCEFDIVKFVICGLMRYRSYEEFYRECNFPSPNFQPVTLDKNRQHALDFLGRFEYSPNLWESFNLVRNACLIDEKGSFLYPELSSTDLIQEPLDNIIVFLRDLFDECLVTTSDHINEKKIQGSVRLINIDHDNPIYKEFFQKLEQLITNVSELNTIEEEERELLLSQLTAGRVILSAKKARLNTINVTLLNAFRCIMTRFPGTTIEEDAEHLLNQLVDWLKLK